MATFRLPRPSYHPPILIGLYSPKPQQGKTTAAHLLLTELQASRIGSDEPHLLSFAAPLKLAAAAVLEAWGLSDVAATRAIFDTKDSPIAQLGGLTGRAVLASFGPWAREAAGADIWVRRAFAKIRPLLRKGVSVVIDDVRFENEAQAIRDAGGCIVRVTKDSAAADTKHAQMPTEARLEALEFSAILHNTGTLGTLRQDIKELVRGIR